MKGTIRWNQDGSFGSGIVGITARQGAPQVCNEAYDVTYTRE